MNKIESDKMILDKVKQALDYLYDIDMLYYILKDEALYDLFGSLFPELSEKYLIDIDPEDEQPFSEDSEEIKAMKPIEWFGEDTGFVVKDNEYFLLLRGDDECWYIDKINTNNLEMARKIVSIFEFLGDLESFKHDKKTAQRLLISVNKYEY